MTIVPWQGRHPSHKARLLAWLLLLLPIALILLYPLANDYLQAASLLRRISDPKATGWLANYEVHPVDVRDTTFNFRGERVLRDDAFGLWHRRLSRGTRVSRPHRRGRAQLRAGPQRAESGHPGDQLLRRLVVAGRQRSPILAVDRMGGFGWRILRSRPCSALLCDGRGGSSRWINRAYATA